MSLRTPEEAIAALRDPERSLTPADCAQIASCIGRLCSELAAVTQLQLLDPTDQLTEKLFEALPPQQDARAVRMLTTLEIDTIADRCDGLGDHAYEHELLGKFCEVNGLLAAPSASAAPAEPICCFCPACFVEVALNEMDAVSRDAKRYRTLRSWSVRPHLFVSDGNNPIYDERLDVALDALIGDV